MKENRNPLYAKVAIARKQLPEMEDDTFFRDWLSNMFWGKRSCKDLTFQELGRCVDLLGRMGAKFTSKGNGAAAVGRRSRLTDGDSNAKRQQRPYVRADFIQIPDNDPNAGMKRAICAIWRKLGYAMTGLETRVERQTDVVTILALNDWRELRAILTDLQRRERAFDARAAERVMAAAR